MIEAELISIFVEGYKRLGIDIVIKYNNRKLMNGLIEICNISKAKINQVITLIDKIEKMSKDELMHEFYNLELKEEQVEELFKYLNLELDSLNRLFKDTNNINLKEGLKELNDLNNYINSLCLDGYVKFSPSLARGQEYYTGTIFEVYAKDGVVKSSIGGGGRYDNMIVEFINDGKNYPAVGISFGLDVIFEILKQRREYFNNTEVYIIPMENNILALELAEELRKNNINVDIEMTNLKLKKALNIVNEKNIPIAIILGSDEIKENKIIIKDMRNSFQIYEKMEDYIGAIKELLSIGKLNYKILNPGGNITALVNGFDYSAYQKKLINKLIMSKYSKVEQVGFLSNKTNQLEMAGGEFCMNATRCAVYEYTKNIDEPIEILVSGTNQKIIGKKVDNNNIDINLEINKKINELIEKRNDFTSVKLDGILVAILDEEKSKKYINKLKENEEKAKKQLKQIMINEIDSKEKAIAIVLLEKNDEKRKINPVVWVKDIDTMFYETACGSGSLGTAIYRYITNNEKKLRLLQPSGYYIDIELNVTENYIKSALITGIVKEE